MLEANAIIFFVYLARHKILTVFSEVRFDTGKYLYINLSSVGSFIQGHQSINYINSVINPYVYNVFNFQYRKIFQGSFFLLV